MQKALLVGINQYPGCPLQGCVNDVLNMANYLITVCGFKRQDIHILTDRNATTSNILRELAWLVSGCQPGDKLLFHYSGHGAQVPTSDLNSEPDGLLEVICPVEFDWTAGKMITDKQFVSVFKNIPDGVIFNWISDSCHSGDLDREFVTGNPHIIRSKAYPMPHDIKWTIDIVHEKHREGKIAKGMVSGMMPKDMGVVLHVGFISGCRSDQTSADTVLNGKPSGALTGYLLEALKTHGNDPLNAVVAEVNRKLRLDHYSQEPQAEGLRANLPFLK